MKENALAENKKELSIKTLVVTYTHPLSDCDKSDEIIQESVEWSRGKKQLHQVYKELNAWGNPGGSIPTCSQCDSDYLWGISE